MPPLFVTDCTGRSNRCSAAEPEDIWEVAQKSISNAPRVKGEVYRGLSA